MSYIQAIWIFDAPPSGIQFLHILSHACINDDILARKPTFSLEGKSIRLNIGYSLVLSAKVCVLPLSLCKKNESGFDVLFQIS